MKRKRDFIVNVYFYFAMYLIKGYSKHFCDTTFTDQTYCAILKLKVK